MRKPPQEHAWNSIQDATGDDSVKTLCDEIVALKKARNAVILAHNYQIPEVQSVADYIGDSLGLAHQAATSEADVIVFCGVHFMAETAAILSPEKIVLLPQLGAGCSLAEMIDVNDIRTWKNNHPDGLVVSYVNTSAAVKAESYICCTSSNAVDIVSGLPPGRPILFVPDFYLGAYVREKTGREIDIWMGECHVHAGIRGTDIDHATSIYPDAELMVHPECGCTTGILIQRPELPLLSTSKMVSYAQSSVARQFLVATEVGILHQLREKVPDKSFIPIRADAICPYMKMTTCRNVRDALRRMENQVTVDEPVAGAARAALERMLKPPSNDF